MHIDKEKLNGIRNLQSKIRSDYADKAYILLIAKSVLPEDGISGFFMRKYKEKLDKAEETFAGAGRQVLDFQIGPYNSDMICYEDRPISTKEEFLHCKTKYLRKISKYKLSAEWLVEGEKTKFDKIISDFLKKMEEVFEEDKEATKEE